MACTTILVGRKASYDGSTLIARNEDSANGEFNPKRLVVVKPQDQPRVYKSVLSHVTVELPDNPMQYTSCLLYTSPSPRDISGSRMPSSA